MKAQYGVDSMPETGENVAEEFQVSPRRPGRVRAPLAEARGRRRSGGLFADEITPVTRARRQGRADHRRQDEHPRPDTTIEGLAKLKPFVASRHGDRRQRFRRQRRRGRDDPGVGGGGKRHGLTPRARVLGWRGRRAAAHHGHRPGAGDAKLMERLGLKMGDFDVIELNEAFASPGHRRACASSASRTTPSREPPWRRHRARPSARHERRAPGVDRGPRLEKRGGKLR